MKLVYGYALFLLVLSRHYIAKVMITFNIRVDNGYNLKTYFFHITLLPQTYQTSKHLNQIVILSDALSHDIVLCSHIRVG